MLNFIGPMNNSKNEIQLPYVRIKYAAPIVYFEYKDVELGFPEIRELIACAETITGHQPYVTLADVRCNVNITNEGRRVIDDPNNMPFFRGAAALVKNGVYKFAVNFMNNFNRPKYPFRAFTSKEKAISWLLSLPLE